MTVAASACATVLALAACTPGGAVTDPTASPSATENTDPDRVESHESSPESPIAYGLTVPRGAVQLGPLVRIRSDELIETYRPELEALLAEEAAEDEEDVDEDQPTEGESEPTPEPTPTDVRPEQDTFSKLDEPPRPDTVISVMRIDEDPATVTRAMLAQISALLPDEDVDIDDLSSYCDTTNDRVDHCGLNVTGVSPAGRKLTVKLDVDPGDLDTRTANAFSSEHPVMVLRIAYVGDPREGQENTENEQLDDVPEIDTPEKSGLIWPKMDVDAPGDGKLVGPWKAPKDSQVLLTGRHPAFAVVYTHRATEGASVAHDYITAVTGVEEPERDVVADLNEVNSVSTAQAPDGTTAQAVHVVTARGNYVFLFSVPPT